MGLLDFIRALSENYILLITSLLTLLVILINGWTDAPNAIATAVSTKSITPKKAVILAAVFNFLGVLFMTMLNATVAQTIYKMVDFRGDASAAISALCAGMVGILMWAVAAWAFGIPTSESHALIAGISGAAIALQGGFSGINGSEWVKVIYGLLISSVLGFGSGLGVVKLIEAICMKMDRRKTGRFFRKAQVGGAAAMAFMHGAQDGQKFMGIFALALVVGGVYPQSDQIFVPVWIMFLIAIIIAIGTSVGGYRIIKTMGMDMVSLEKYQGFSAEIGASACMIGATVLGIPLSTTNAKGTAIMGAGAARRLSNVNWNVVKEMLLAWALTFPACLVLGYVMAKIFNYIF